MIAVGAIGRVVENYLAERQRLGYRMDDTELRRFARYADARGHEGPLDAELQIRWARLHVNLRDADLDADGRRLVIRMTKFRKSRQLPLHPSTATALLAYRHERDRYWPRAVDQPFFVGRHGTAVSASTLGSVFINLRRNLGWRARGDYAEPRLHDLRHNSERRIIPSGVVFSP
jgi:integrase